MSTNFDPIKFMLDDMFIRPYIISGNENEILLHIQDNYSLKISSGKNTYKVGYDVIRNTTGFDVFHYFFRMKVLSCSDLYNIDGVKINPLNNYNIDNAFYSEFVSNTQTARMIDRIAQIHTNYADFMDDAFRFSIGNKTDVFVLKDIKLDPVKYSDTLPSDFHYRVYPELKTLINSYAKFLMSM